MTGKFCPLTTLAVVWLKLNWDAPAGRTVTYKLGHVVALPTWQSVIDVDPEVFPDTVICEPLMLTFAIEAFELFET